MTRDYRDLYVFSSHTDAEHRFPRRERPVAALVTDARSLNAMPNIIYGLRIRHAFIYAPINDVAVAGIQHRQHRTAEESKFYGFEDVKPPLPATTK